jgi:CPA1 family monovalent cation:H+ antiporter
VAVVFAGRAVSVAAVSFVVRRTVESFDRRWPKVLFWGGLRGSLSMALALSLPGDFPGRRLLLTLVFGVVAFSLLVQGLTMKPLLRRWGLAGGSPLERDFEMRRGALLAKQRALEELGRIERGGYVSHETAQRIRPRLEEEIASLKTEVSSSLNGDSRIGVREERVARLRIWSAEKEAVKEALRIGILSPESAGELVGAIDGEREAFAAGEGEPAPLDPAAEGHERV